MKWRCDEPEDRALVQYLVVDLTSQYRGNRVTSRLYPDQYARVLYAKWLTQRYAPAVDA